VFTRVARTITLLSLLTPMPTTARAQDSAPAATLPATLDVADLWKLVRKKPVAAETEWDYRQAMKAIAPVIGAKPSAGALVGIAGNVAFFRGDPNTTNISSVVASLTYSSKQQTALSVRYTLFTDENVWRFEGDNRAQWTSQDTYGLGTSSDIGAAVNAQFNWFRIHETVYRELRTGVFAGAGLHFDNHTDIHPGSGASDTWDQTAFVEYSNSHGLPLDRQSSAGPSVSLLLDSRDSVIDPRGGWYGAANYRGLIKGFLGGTSGWQLLHLEGRTYKPLTPDNRQRLAFWLYGDYTFGGAPPYFDLPATAMDPFGRSGRGYGEGRFRGERLMYGEVEYRGTLMKNGLLGMVAFLNATTVTNLQADEHLFDNAAPGAGAGLRLLLNKRSRTNLCFDVGGGKSGSHGVYLNVQEAF
jgi:outer membrane protein assembly factor BamA